MSNQVVGFTSAVEGQYKRTYEQQRGSSTTRTHVGTQAQIEALEASYQFNGWNTTVTDGPMWKLEATIPAVDSGSGPVVDDPIDQWELFANKFEKDILSANTTLVAALSNAKINYLRDVLDGKVETASLDCSTTATTPPAILGDSSAISLYKLICSGGKSYDINVPTIRHTKTASQQYEFDSAVTNAGYIFTTEALKAAETIPLGISNNMPPSPGTNPLTRTDAVQVLYGWKKHYPQITISAYNKAQIIVEYEYGAWATLMYSAAT